ncbi:MAG: VOC family protein, partial [Candidatus Eremiobacteraeota bacterium]|nr:VOC family protein [Candidatus Eremiobacteraeota bacterium]
MDATDGIVPAALTLGVADIDATERFYRDKLGVALVRHGDAVRITFGEFPLVFEHAPPTE